MDNEYVRLLNNDTLSNLFVCKQGYVDVEDCSWYHPNWILLRYLGMVSNPAWHEEFYLSAFRKYLKSSDKVLVVGTADFSMPFICEKAGIINLTISDLCQTPLNICMNVSSHHGFGWTTEKMDIFSGIPLPYNAIVNDAFITRFAYDDKRTVFKRIYDGLVDDGVYITTMRHAWNGGKAVVPSENEKQDFVRRAERSAEKKNINIELAAQAASQYIEKMISYPIRDEAMLTELTGGLFTIEQMDKACIVGECVPTEYFRVVLRKR